MILFLLACSASPDSTAEVDPGETAPISSPPVDSAVQPAPVGSPAEAEDLDPAATVVRVELSAAPHPYEAGGEEIEGYAYNGQVPGPTIRARRGDRLVVELHNQLETETTIHWHGVHVPWEMDGVTWMQDPVGPGERFTYEFTLDQVGTFWYHPHFDTEQQVDLGLYGVLVVEDSEAPALEERIIVLDALREYETEQESEHVHEAQVLPTQWTVNGQLAPVELEPADGPVRLRVLNASNLGYAALSGPGMRVIATDQGLLEEPREPEQELLAPGDRAELELVGQTELSVLPWTLAGGPALGDPSPLLSVQLPDSEPAALDYGGQPPSPDPGHTDVLYSFQGDGDVWMINGELFPDVTVHSLPLGADAVVEVRNISPSNHPFHLHGHHFELLSVDGIPPTYRSIEDTVDVGIRQTLRLQLQADNPGDWMAHCHILPHAEQGMMTVLRVE